MYKRPTFWHLSIMICFIFLVICIDDPSMAQGLQRPTVSPQPQTIANMELRRALMDGDGLPISVPASPRVAVGAITPQAPDGIYAWSKVAYQAYLNGNFEVIVAMADGTSAQRLTYNTADDILARLNRGATQVAFASNRDGDYEIFKMNVDGTNVQQLTTNSYPDLKPTWSPDGQKIAYISRETGYYEVYVINADGSNKVKLTSSNQKNCYDPSWSPDGTRIAFVTWDGNGNGNVWTVPAYGGSSTKFFNENFQYPGDPAWSPDGIYLGFDYGNISYNQSEVIAYGFQGTVAIYMNIPNQVPYEDHYLGGWSPDNQQVIFNRIQYRVAGNQLVVTGAYVETRCARSGSSCSRSDIRLPGTGLDFLPDWQSADIYPPNTTMTQLPPYSRFDGFVLSWKSQTDGLAPLTGYNLNYRINQEEWSPRYLYRNPSSSEWFSSGKPGDTLSFRLQAYDEAGNNEPWTSSPFGDTHTTLYTLQLGGNVADARGFPLPATALSVDPQPANQISVDAGGKYQVWLNTRDVYTIIAQTPGYGPLPNTQRNPHTDQLQNLYFPTEDNSLQNGNFETGTFQGWNISPTVTVSTNMTASLLTDYRYTGNWAASLGNACREPCMTAAEIFNSNQQTSSASGTEAPENRYSLAEIAIDDSGTIYIIAWQGSGLYAYTRSPQGIWSQPQLLEFGFASSPVPTYLRMTADGQGYAIWMSPVDAKFKFTSKLPGLPWQSVTDLSVAANIKDVILDLSGGLYLLYTNYEDLYYISKPASGSWQSPVLVADRDHYDGDASIATMALTSDQALHVFWQDHQSSGDSLYYQKLRLDGTILEELRLRQYATINPNLYMTAVADSLDQVHLFYPGWPNAIHVERYADGTWSAHEQLPSELGLPNSVAINSDGLYARGSNYYTLVTGQGWFLPPTSSVIGNAIAVGKDNILHSTSTSEYNTLQRATEPGRVSISQVLNLPTDVHHPTLSFLSQLRGKTSGHDSFFGITISDSIKTTQIFTETETHLWEHNWIPMDNWLGKTITITFTLNQGVGDPFVYLDLDDISLGAWLTPVISKVEPSQIPEWGTNETIIHGDNFIPTPTINIGNYPVQSIEWINEHMLRIMLPIGLPFGIFDVWVTNPSGQQAVLPGGLRLGSFAYIPIVIR